MSSGVVLLAITSACGAQDSTPIPPIANGEASSPVPSIRNSLGFAASAVFPGIDSDSPCAMAPAYAATNCPVTARLRSLLLGWAKRDDPIRRCKGSGPLPGVGPVTSVSDTIAHVESIGGYEITLVNVIQDGRWLIDDACCTGTTPEATGLLSRSEVACATPPSPATPASPH